MTIEKNIPNRGQVGTRPLGFDDLDMLPILATDESLVGNATHTIPMAAAEIAVQGGNGEAIRRLMAREICLRRLAVRRADLCVAHETHLFLKNPNSNIPRLRAAQLLLKDEHRRLLDTVRDFSRLTATTSIPNITVNSNQTVVAVQSVSDVV
jgi:hypothetical protein